MTLRSPIAAVLWEVWRITRTEIVWKLALPIGGALAALTLAAAFGPSESPARYQDANDFVAAVALTLIVVPHIMGWLSLAALNGGRPGFPMDLLYTRPVRTTAIVALPMIYLTAVSTGIYLVSALTLRMTFGYAFPLLPVAAWVAALTVVSLAASWSTRHRGLQLAVIMFAVARALNLAIDRLTAVELPNTFDWPPRLWPTLFDWPRNDYAWIALIVLGCFGITILMVSLQRRGDGLGAITWILSSPAGAMSRGVPRASGRSLIRIPCPTWSSTLAQMWFDLRSNGLPVVTVGVTLATAILLVSAVSGPIDAALNARPDIPCKIAECFYVRAMPVFVAPISLFGVLLLAGNGFGIHRRRGRTYVSTFEATQALGNAHVAILKLVVRSVCVLVAFIAIALSVWMSMPLLGDAVFVQMWGVPLSSRRDLIGAAFTSLSGYQQLAFAIVAAVVGVVGVATFAVFGALRARYSRRATVAGVVLALYGLAFIWLAVGVRVDPGTASRFHLDVVYHVMGWTAAAAMMITTIYVFRDGFAEHVLTLRYMSAAVAISVTFGAAWLTALNSAGVQLDGMSSTNVISVLSPALLPLMTSGLAPWAYGRVRHT